MTTIKRVIRETVTYNEFVRGDDTSFYLDDLDFPEYNENEELLPLEDLGIEF